MYGKTPYLYREHLQRTLLGNFHNLSSLKPFCCRFFSPTLSSFSMYIRNKKPPFTLHPFLFFTCFSNSLREVLKIFPIADFFVSVAISSLYLLHPLLSIVYLTLSFFLKPFTLLCCYRRQIFRDRRPCTTAPSPMQVAGQW
jgi:hypothetical protein